MQNWIVKASLFGLFTIYLIWMLWSWSSFGAAEDGTPDPDGSSATVAKLMAVLAAALFFGFLAIVYLIPMIGDLTSTFFYSSGEVLETDENMRGTVLLAQGNYEGAIAEYQKNAEKDPESRFPVTEMAKIYVDKLDDPQSALDVLHGALERPWEPDDAAFILFRIAEIQSDNLADFDAARQTLDIVIEQLPDTRHSANATHKLREIDENEVIANQRIARGESPLPLKEEPAADPKAAARLQREKEEAEFLAKLQARNSPAPAHDVDIPYESETGDEDGPATGA